MSKDLCALDFSTNSVQVLVRRRSGAAQSTDALLPSEAIADGKILEPVAIQLYLSRFFKDLKLKAVPARIAISDTACVTRFVRFPKMPARDLERSLRYEADRELPMTRRDAYIGWQVVGDDGKHQTVLLVGAWRDLVEGYLDAVEGLGRVTIIEPRSLALARAVGLPDAVLMDWTGDRLQIVVVDQTAVAYTTSVLVPDGAEDSPRRIAHALLSLLPKGPGPRAKLPQQLVLLGRLQGREDLSQELSADTRWRFNVVTDWRPAEPFSSVAGASQTANIGMLPRNGQTNEKSAPTFAAINLMPDRERVRGLSRPTVRARFWLALAGAVTVLVAVMGVLLLPALVPR